MLAVKSYRRNSVIYAHEKAYKLAPVFGISPQTFNAYMKRLDAKGLIRTSDAGHRTLVSLKTAIPTLLPEYHPEDGPNTFKHCRFFAGQVKSHNVKHHTQRIRFAIAELNFKQQQHNITANEILDARSSDRLSTKQFQSYKRLLKKHGATSLQLLRSTVKRITGIVTGKHHLSRLIGCSPATALNMLRSWHKNGCITRTVQTQFIPCFVCPASYDAIKALGAKYIIPSLNRTGFTVSVGSLISSPGR